MTPERFEAEVRAFHDALTAWFSGTAPDSDEGFATLGGAVADDFVLISPRGEVGRGAGLMDRIRGAHGMMAGGGLAIRIENAELRFAGDGHCLGTYEAWQESAGGSEVRLATALFRARAGARHGLEWLHLHETWLKGHAPGG